MPALALVNHNVGVFQFLLVFIGMRGGHNIVVF